MRQTHMRISQWRGKLLLTAAYLLLVGCLYFWKIPCLFQWIFSVPCPGCGMTRALLAAMRLDLRAAAAYHPMFWSMPILYLYFLLDKGIFPRKRWNCVVLWGIGIGFAVSWILKIV